MNVKFAMQALDCNPMAHAKPALSTTRGATALLTVLLAISLKTAPRAVPLMDCAQDAKPNTSWTKPAMNAMRVKETHTVTKD